MGRGLSLARTHPSIDDPSLLKLRRTARAGPSSARAAQPRPPRRRTNSHRWPAVTIKRSRTPPAHLISGGPTSAGQTHPQRLRRNLRITLTVRRQGATCREFGDTDSPEDMCNLSVCQPAIDRESGHQAQASAEDAEEPSRHAQPRQDQQPQLRRFNSVVVLASNVTTSAGSTYAVRAAMKRRTTSSPPRLR